MNFKDQTKMERTAMQKLQPETCLMCLATLLERFTSTDFVHKVPRLI
jgi:hypothetical protein